MMSGSISTGIHEPGNPYSQNSVLLEKVEVVLASLRDKPQHRTYLEPVAPHGISMTP